MRAHFGAVRALWVGALVGAVHLACIVRASPGDELARSDFRNQNWVVEAPGGTGSGKGMELDYAQNAIKLKDAGKHSWWFESPAGFFKGDMTLAYNGTVEFQLQSLEWEATFLEGYDIVLVSKNKRHTIGLKGVKQDGDTSKTYSVRLSESAGAWEHLYPTLRKDGGGMRVEVVKEDMIKALSTIKAIRVRGGYYMGVEKTQLRSLRLVQGVQAEDEALTTGDSECCGDRDRTCTSSSKFDIIFDNKGLDCVDYTTVSTGTLVAGDNAGTLDKLVRLAMGVSSPDADFYKDGKLEITGGACGPAGGSCSGTVTNYLGELSWTINSGVTQVEVEATTGSAGSGSGCATGGFFAAGGTNGSGFDAVFDVTYTIPAVTLSRKGVGCAGIIEGPFSTITVGAGGVVTAVTLPNVTGTGYISGRAYVHCVSPCTGGGLVVDCTASGGGDIQTLTVAAGGSGYQAGSPPTVYCPSGTVGARTSEGPFRDIQGTWPGPVSSVTLPAVLGSGYLAGEAIVECNPPCVGNGLRVSCAVDAWGDITGLTVITPGTGYDPGAGWANAPTIKCREDERDPPNPGTGFAGTFVTDNVGGILYVAVTNAGSGYNANIKITQTPKLPTCVGFVWTPQPSGYLPIGTSTVRILSPGTGFTQPPDLSIRSGGAGCKDFLVRTVVGDATPDTLVDGALSGGIISLRATSCDYRDGYYDGMTFLWLKADASKVEVRQIKSFTSVGRTVTLETPLTETPVAGDIFAITKTPALTLEPYLSLLYGKVAANMACTCTGGSRSKVDEEAEATRSSCVCEVTLQNTASSKDDFYNHETIYFPSLDVAAVVVDYTGATKKAKVAVRASGNTGYNRELPSAQAIVVNTLYLLSARHLAKVALTMSDGTHALAHTNATSTYTMAYRDYSATLQAHARGQPFFCEQAVGKNAAFLTMPFTRTFGFSSMPLICSPATLTVAAEGQFANDLLWPGNNLTVLGENGELLGTLFTEPSTLLGMQEGAPVHDSITLSQEKMLEMTSDGSIVLTLEARISAGGVKDKDLLGWRGGALKIHQMKLSFSPAACFSQGLATDMYEVRDDVTPGRRELFYNLSFYLPPSSTGTPVSDGVLTVTADANFADASLEVQYAGSTNVTLFSDWVWGSHEKVYALSEPADVAVVCDTPTERNVDLQRYTITGVIVTNGGSGCSATTTEGPFSNITENAGAVQSVTLPAVTGDGYISGKAIITSHGSGSGLVVSCTANANGDITGLTVDTAGTGYSTTHPPVIYCPEGTVAAKPTLGTTNPGQNFAGVYATNGRLNGGAIIGVFVTNVGTGYTKNVKFTHTSFGNSTTCTSTVAGLGQPVLAYQSVVAPDPAVPDRVCKRASLVPVNNTHTDRHTAHHRIPRRVLTAAAAKGVFPVSFKVRNAMTAKLSPVRLTYALMRCKLMTLDASSGIPGIASAAFRPSNILLEFPGDAPPAAGPATVWVQAHIQNHKLHVRDTWGSPNGFPRGGILDTDLGEPYYTELKRARDPEEELKIQQRYWPHLGALRLRIGDSGESVDWMFLSDYSQYAPDAAYVDSLEIPLSMMTRFALSRKVTLTLEVPPGDSTIVIQSVVLAYPHTEA